MRFRVVFFVAAVAGIVSASGQDQPQPSRQAVQGSASQVNPELRPRPPESRATIALGEKPYRGGVLPNLAKGNLLAPPPQPQWSSPVQNPAIDLTTGRHRGVVLFSFNF